MGWTVVLCITLAGHPAISYSTSYMSLPPPAPPPLHELESEVMNEVWHQQEATVRTVMEALNAAAHKARAYTTYMTILSRLDGKGLLQRRREGKTDYYRPAHTREEYAELRAQAEVEALVDQFGDIALSHFARQMAQLDPDRRRALERLVRKRA
jgi:predicted transcriptional regulator